MAWRRDDVRRGAGWLVIWLALVAGASSPAQAGAWTRPKGEGLLITTLSIHELRPANDLTGLDRMKGEVAAYGEYGLSHRITLVGRAAWQTMTVTEPVFGVETYREEIEREPDPKREDPNEDWNDDGIINRFDPAPALPPIYRTRERSTDITPPPETGVGGIEAGVRIQLYKRQRWVGSTQLMAIIPGGGENQNNDRFGVGDGGFDARLMAGRSIGRSSFISVGTGVRSYLGDRPDEARLDITAGTHLTRGVRVMAQTYSVWSLGQAHRTNYRYQGHRAQASVIWPLDDHRRLSVSVLSTLAESNMSRERAVMASLWRRF